ncbi:MAG: PD40 domain-containing protein, partial [Candidatus Fermentibacteraceae bacterium]|nr:PD40 domain-containing protein [Candidatus Fermentibacteraceae bacterium]
LSLVFSLEYDGMIKLVLANAEMQDTVLIDSAFPEIHILSTSVDVAGKPVWSPQGDRIAYLDGPGRLHVIDVRNEQDITLCGTPDIIHHSWSPDGMWLAFSVPVLAHREEIFVVSSHGGEPVNISRHPNDDFQPFWPTDGRRILFASRTDDGNYSIKQIWLTREDWDCDTDEREALLDDHRVTVEIEWDGLQRRTETLCTVTGYYDFYGSSPDGRIIAFPAWDSNDRMDLWTVDWKGESLSRITWSGEFPENILVTGDEEIYYIALGGIVKSASVEGGIGGAFGWRMPVWRSIPEIQAQKFDEAWRLLRDNFYDSDMHQVDWDAMRIKYRERAVSSITGEDFNDVVRRMLGELSASHLGIYGSWYFDSSPRSGSVGIIPDYNWTGNGIRVDSVIPYSPADLDGSLLLPGDIIISIHGIPVGADDNLYRALLQRSGRETRFHVLRDNVALDVDIEPVPVWRIGRLLYDEWIERNRREVARLTDGRVGYLHIPSMSNRSVNDFLVDLFAEGMNRDGMIIDVRFNGGGSTHDEIIRELGRPMYMFSRDRHGNITFEPLGVWQKPLVLLINERCYSDAEIFPGGWKELDLGPVVGEKTYGAVIGTSNVILVDGTAFRIPATGWFTLTGENLENTGVEPDIRVLEQPADAGLNIDRQLETATEIMMDLI